MQKWPKQKTGLECSRLLRRLPFPLSSHVLITLTLSSMALQISRNYTTSTKHTCSNSSFTPSFKTSIYPPADPGEGAIRPWPPFGLSMGLAPQPSKIFYHTKIANNLVSVYSVFFQPHSTSEPITLKSIHIIVLVYTCMILPLTLPLHLLCTPSDYLLHIH